MMNEMKSQAQKTVTLWGAVLGVIVFLFTLSSGFLAALFLGIVAGALFRGVLNWAFMDGTLDLQEAEIEVGKAARAVPPMHSVNHDAVVAYTHKSEPAAELSEKLADGLDAAESQAKVHMDKVDIIAATAESRIRHQKDQPGWVDPDEEDAEEADPAEGAADPGEAPQGIAAPRNGQGDDLKLIEGIGPKLEERLNSWGIWHYDQIAAWGPAQVAYADANVPRFKGRCTRDKWVAQAKLIVEEGKEAFLARAKTNDY
ncbi:hypothetical protein [Thioclava sp. GXIMD4215]|uniref:hypothetical protein n=1 Tax=Thioclava sp. GXIMD4215 TaxID=3131928 RepID=UPI003248761F